MTYLEPNRTIFTIHRGDTPIAELFNGIQKKDSSYFIHMQLWDGCDYAFDYCQIEGAIEPRQVELQSVDTGDVFKVVLSSDELAYIHARKNGSGYDEVMALSGCPDGHYGHRPY